MLKKNLFFGLLACSLFLLIHETLQASWLPDEAWIVKLKKSINNPIGLTLQIIIILGFLKT